jgi:sugar-specific transcriptional regulator TrmB
MSNENIKQDIKRKIDELEGKLIEAKNKLNNEKNPSDELKSLVDELENIHRDISKRYDSEKTKAKPDWDEIDKNIYQDIQSFKKSMTKAGTLFSGN